MKIVLFLLGLMLHAPSWADEPFSLGARIAVRHHDTAYHGTLNWQHALAGDQIFVAGPFGQGAAELRSTPEGAQLRLPDGRRHQAESLDALAEGLFGAPLPLSLLADWLRGIAPDAHPDEQGRPGRLAWQDWLVTWIRYADDGRPQLLLLEDARGEVALRVRIDSWDAPQDTLP